MELGTKRDHRTRTEWSTAEVARELGVSVSRVRQFIRSGDLVAEMVKGAYRVQLSSVRQYQNGQ